jgi:hypothetical protein
VSTSVVFEPEIGRQFVKYAERIIYPVRADCVMHEEAAE